MGRDRLEEDVIVGRLPLKPERGMIRVGDNLLRFNPFQPERFELEPGHRSCRVLRQAVVNSDPDLHPPFQAPFAHMA